MAKMLNLDEIKAEEKVLKLCGKEHTMKEMSVEDFIKLTKETEKYESGAKEMSLSEQMESLVDMVLKAFPTCPREDLMSQKLDMLTVILKFVRSDVEPDEEDSAVKK